MGRQAHPPADPCERALLYRLYVAGAHDPPRRLSGTGRLRLQPAVISRTTSLEFACLPPAMRLTFWASRCSFTTGAAASRPAPNGAKMFSAEMRIIDMHAGSGAQGVRPVRRNPPEGAVLQETWAAEGAFGGQVGLGVGLRAGSHLWPPARGIRCVNGPAQTGGSNFAGAAGWMQFSSVSERTSDRLGTREPSTDRRNFRSSAASRGIAHRLNDACGPKINRSGSLRTDQAVSKALAAPPITRKVLQFRIIRPLDDLLHYDRRRQAFRKPVVRFQLVPGIGNGDLLVQKRMPARKPLPLAMRSILSLPRSMQISVKGEAQAFRARPRELPGRLAFYAVGFLRLSSSMLCTILGLFFAAVVDCTSMEWR